MSTPRKAVLSPAPPLLPAVARVREFRQETADTFTLTLQPPAQEFHFQPGQFNMLYAFGVGESAISLSGAAASSTKIVHTIRAVGSVTRALAQVRPGGAIGMRGPYGSAWPMAAAAGGDVVIVAGGIGLAPLRPAIYWLLEHRAAYGRLVLLYGARTPADVLFSAELAQWHARQDFQVLVTVDQATASWSGAVGLVTSLFGQAIFEPGKTTALLCGPEVMMRFCVRELEQRGVPEQQIYVTLERNMQCAVGVCGHCQLGPEFVCLDGPVFRYDRVKKFFLIREA